MERRIALLRAINLGARNRVAMPELREHLTEAGYGDVRTYVQSGNVVLDSDEAPAKLAAALRRLIQERFELEVPVIVRTRDELAEVVKANPLRGVATDPKRYQVTFLDRELPRELLAALAGLTTGEERFQAIGREIYGWHPDGVRRSRLWARLATGNAGVTATARNWNTVEQLLAMADA